ncbi:endonuclease/exonuclease/phosphatase family protein [Psychroflexus sp. MBR-150]
MRSVIYVGLMLFWVLTAWSQNTAKIMFYNLLDFPEAPPDNRELILKDIIDQVQPDVFMVAELQNQNGADLILNQALNDTQNIYAAAPFVFNTSGSGGTINQLLFYNTQKFGLELTDIIQTSLRDINRYQLKALTDQNQTNPIIIDFFVAHFKASQGDSNEQIRFDMALDFTNYINAHLSANANVILAGDFNFYTANESGFQQLFIGNTIIPMHDPVNQLGDWHINSTYSDVHSQSTRVSNSNFNGFGAGGGLDDRFDFIFVSGNFLDVNNQAHYIDGTYQVFGNNSNCFNKNVNDTTCSGIFSQNIRNLLWNMSDHLPVVMDLEFEQNFLNTIHFSDSSIFKLPEGNIVDNTLFLEISATHISEIKQLNIYNTLGQQMKTLDVLKSTMRISMDDLSNGIYILKANRGNALKFVVLH